MEKVREVQTKKGKPIFTLMGAPLVALSVLFISLSFSILIELVGMTWFWPEEGSSHSKTMLLKEINYLNDGAKRSIYSTTPMDMAEGAVLVVHDALNLIGLKYVIEILEQPPVDGEIDFISNLRVLFQGLREYIYATLTVIELFFVRVVVTILSMPIFILYGLGAFVDGLVERDRRKFGGGYETAWVYHKVKRGLMPVLIGSILIYLSMPVSIHPNYVFTPCAVLFGIFLFVYATTFKKYI